MIRISRPDAGSQPVPDQQAHDAPSAVAGHRRYALGERASLTRVLLKRWSWIVLIAGVVTACAAILSEMQTPIYKAQAEVAVYPASSAGSGLQPFVMGTEKGVAASGAVLSVASQFLYTPESKLQRGLSIRIPVDTDILQISYSDPNPQFAQAAAEQIAQAYVAYRSLKAAPTTTGNTAAPPSTSEALRAVVITDAPLPTSPVSPNRPLIIGAGLILGLALGIGMALLRDQMDDGLRGPLDLQTHADAPVLALIPAFYRKQRGIADGLVILRNPSSAIAEAYRNLRTRVAQVAAWRRVNLLLVTSPNGEDKSTVAANLAATLALSGRTVVLVCADLRYGRTHALFGLDNRFGLTNVVNGEVTLADALRWTEVSTLSVLPAGQAYFDASSVLQSTTFRNLVSELRKETDFVVIEAPPVLAGADTAALSELGAMILLVADARTSTRSEVRTAIRELGHVRDDVIGCVLDNVGRARRLPQTIAAAMRRINVRANSERPAASMSSGAVEGLQPDQRP